MPVFHYEAITAAGKMTSGKFTGEIVSEAEQYLLSNGLSPVSIQIVAPEDAEKADGFGKISLKERLLGIRLDDIILFCRQIATMLTAGVTVLQALRIMAKQVNNQVLRNIVVDLAASIEGGAGLSDSFAKYPKVFSPLFQNVIRTGEESGSLDKSFSYLAILHENEKDINERIKAATRYPKIVLTAMFGAVFFLMSFVVPKFVRMFTKAGIDLPLPTRILITVSDLFANNFFTITLGIVAMVVLYHICLNYEEFVYQRDKLVLKIPIIGDLSTKIYMSRFCRVFEILISSGVDIIKTLHLSASALDNVVLFKLLGKTTEEVEDGVDLHTALAKHDQFPSMVEQMIAVGEESGQLDTMMGKVADYYELETNYTIKNLSSLIEPVMLLFMGVLVGFIALAIFMPMWNMMNIVKG
jgi:type II secretory pathway component PulF